MSEANKQISGIKRRLEALNCPYLEDESEPWLAQLLLHPCEVRVRLLMWMITLFDEQLNDILQSTVPYGNTHADAKYKKILITLNVIGLCQVDDMDIVRGTASQKKQLSFWDHFLDLIYISQNGCLYSDEIYDETILLTSREPTLSEGLKYCCSFIDTLVREYKMKDLFSDELHLFSPDLEAEIKSSSLNQELPAMEFLMETVEKMQSDINEKIKELKNLDDKFTFKTVEQTEIENYCRKFDLSMKMLSQMIDSYIHVHTDEIEAWCNIQTPQQSDIGPQIQSVSCIFQNLLTLTNDLMVYNQTTYTLQELKQDIGKIQSVLTRPEDLIKLREISSVLHQSMSRK